MSELHFLVVVCAAIAGAGFGLLVTLAGGLRRLPPSPEDFEPGEHEPPLDGFLDKGTIEQRLRNWRKFSGSLEAQVTSLREQLREQRDDLQARCARWAGEKCEGCADLREQLSDAQGQVEQNAASAMRFLRTIDAEREHARHYKEKLNEIAEEARNWRASEDARVARAVQAGMAETLNELHEARSRLREWEVFEHAEASAWPLREVLAKLCEASDVLLVEKDYDGHGWELMATARQVAREMLDAEKTRIGKLKKAK